MNSYIMVREGVMWRFRLFACLIFFIIVMFSNDIFPWQQSNSPNYTDIERAVKQMDIPTDWRLIDWRANTGFYKRTCPAMEPGSDCFFLLRQYEMTGNFGESQMKDMLERAGCQQPTIAHDVFSEKTAGDTELFCHTSSGLRLDISWRKELSVNRIDLNFSTN